MTANELRIGNYVFRDSIFIETVKSIDKNVVFTGESLPSKVEDLKPVALIETDLISLGFKKWGKHKTYSKGGVILHLRRRGFVINKRMPIVHYLHQLQNIYFIFTGKEL